MCKITSSKCFKVITNSNLKLKLMHPFTNALNNKYTLNKKSKRTNYTRIPTEIGVETFPRTDLNLICTSNYFNISFMFIPSSIIKSHFDNYLLYCFKKKKDNFKTIFKIIAKSICINKHWNTKQSVFSTCVQCTWNIQCCYESKLQLFHLATRQEYANLCHIHIAIEYP